IFLGTAALYAFSASPLAFFFPQMAHQSGKREGSRATGGCALVWDGTGRDGTGTVESRSFTVGVPALSRRDRFGTLPRPANLPLRSRRCRRLRSRSYSRFASTSAFIG